MKAAIVVLLVSGIAMAEPTVYYVDTPSVLAAQGGMIELPPGYFVPVDAWNQIDAGVKADQRNLVKLRTENAELRKAVDEGTPLLALLIAGVVGAAASGTIVYALTR